MPALTSAGAVPRGAEVTAPASAATVLAHRLVSLAVLCGVPVLVVTADVLADGPLRHLDLLLESGSWHRSEPSLVSAASVFDRLGQRAVAGAVLVAVAAFLAWRGRSWRPLVVTGAALAVLNLVVGAMKVAIGRSKPLSGHDLLYVGGSQFPSGHAANAVVSWGLLVYLVVAYGHSRVPARLLVAAAGVTTVAVGASSLYLDYHWLSDLVAGVALGFVLLALVLAWDLTRADLARAGERVDGETAAVMRSEGLTYSGLGPSTRSAHAAVPPV
jgi:membrane-associated phospholipid phosphatase